MFNTDVALNPSTYGGAATSKTYSLLGNASISESLRRVSATANSTPETLQIKHRDIKVKDVATGQHLVRLDKLFTDPVKGECQLSARLIIEVPKGTSVVTNQEILDIVGRLIAFEQASGNLDKILNAET